MEYQDVFGRMLSPNRWKIIKPYLGLLVAQSYSVDIHFKWRPQSKDPGDEHIIDAAMNANAWVVTYNRKDFLQAQQSLGLKVASPQQFLQMLAH